MHNILCTITIHIYISSSIPNPSIWTDMNRYESTRWIDMNRFSVRSDFSINPRPIDFFSIRNQKKKRKKETKIGYQLIGRNPCNKRRILITFCFVWQWSCRHNVIVIIIVQRRVGGEGRGWMVRIAYTGMPFTRVISLLPLVTDVCGRGSRGKGCDWPVSSRERVGKVSRPEF